MLVGDLFPQIPNARLASEALEFRPESVERDLVLLKVALNSLARGDHFWDEVRAAHCALDDLDDPYGTVAIIRLDLCVAPMNVAAAQKRVSQAWEFTMRSLLPGDPGEKVVDAPLGAAFAAIRAYSRHVESLVDTLVEWCFPFYWLARHTDRSLDELGQELWPLMSRACHRQLRTPRGALAACSLLDWVAVKYPSVLGDNPLVPVVRGACADADWPVESASILSFGLSSRIGERLGLPVAEIAERTIRRHGKLLRGHQLFQLRVTTVAHDADLALATTSQLDADIEQYESQFAGDELSRRRDRSMLFQLITPLVRLAIEAARRDLLVATIHLWMRGGTDKKDSSLLVCIPTNNGIATWVPISGPQKLAEPGCSHVDLMKLTNRALGARIAVNDAPSFELEALGPVGVPVGTAAREWHSCMANYYFEGVNLGPRPDQARLVVAPWLGHPIQPLMIEQVGWTLPIAAHGLLRLEPTDRRRAVLFATPMLGADDEVSLVESILLRNGWTCDTMRGEDASVRSFRDAYMGSEFDLIWVSGHGELDHFDVGSAAIHLADGHVEAGQLLPPTARNQRLLVVNACDMAHASVAGGLAELGLAAIASGPQQAVISHMWPSHWAAAALFGAVLATELGNNADVGLAFEAAVRHYIEGPEACVKSALASTEGLDSEMLARFVRNVPQDWGILEWGTPTMFA